MKKHLLAALSVASLSGAVVAADTFSLDVRHTFPTFEVNHLGLSTQRGRFNKTSGKIMLDMTAKKASVEAVIETASIDMGLEDWDKHMRSEDFFNSDKYPTMTFKSDAFTFEGDKPVLAEGTLTMLGVSKPVKLNIAGFVCKPHPMNKKMTCAADVMATIKRSDWGMSKYVPAVGDDVLIKIPVEAFKD